MNSDTADTAIRLPMKVLTRVAPSAQAPSPEMVAPVSYLSKRKIAQRDRRLRVNFQNPFGMTGTTATVNLIAMRTIPFLLLLTTALIAGPAGATAVNRCVVQGKVLYTD